MDTVDKLLSATLAVIDQGVESHSTTIPELQTFKALLDAPMPRRNIEAAGFERLGGYLPDCVAVARNSLDRALTAALVEAAPRLYWGSPYDDVDGSPLLESFKPHYACTVLAGPEKFRRYQAPVYL